MFGSGRSFGRVEGSMELPVIWQRALEFTFKPDFQVRGAKYKH